MKKILFCLGVTKGGTTWLHWVLSRHPDIVQIPRKEIHYFFRQYAGIDRLTDFARMQRFVDQLKNFRLAAPDDEKGILEHSPVEMYGMPWDDTMSKNWAPKGVSRKKYRKLLQTMNWYRDYLQGPVDDVWFRRLFKNVEDHQWAVDFSTTGFLCKDDGIKDMASFAEDSRAVIILRDPIDRLWSHVKFHAQVTGEIDQLEHWSPSRILQFVEQFDLHTNSFYAEGIEAMIKHFPEDKRMIINFGDLRSRPDELLQESLAFLDLEPMEMPVRKGDDVRINVSKSVPMPAGLFEKFLPDFEADLLRVKACGVDFVDPWIENLKHHGTAQPRTIVQTAADASAPLSRSLVGKAKRFLSKG